MSDGKLGYTCDCGAFHEFGAWAITHLHVKLVHTCEKCGRINHLRNGEVFHAEHPAPARAEGE